MRDITYRDDESPKLHGVTIMDMMKDNLPDNIEIVDASDIIYNLRYIKSVNEQKMLRVSNRICIEMVKEMVEVTEPGIRELEITAYGDFFCKKMGAYAYGFDSFVLSGERINTIIGRGTNKVVEDQEMVRIGVIARYEWYASTATRMVVAGGATKRQAEFINHLIKAHELAGEKFVYGQPKNEVELAAWNYLKKQGLGQYQVYSVAHGTGISECLEGIAFTKYTKELIEKKISMMIDVGLYNHLEFYGGTI